MNYAAMRAELQADPRGYGYAPLLGARNDSALADLLNLVRDGTDGFAEVTVKRIDVRSADIVQAIDTRDMASNPGTALLNWFQAVVQIDVMRLVNDDGTDTPVFANFKRLVTLDTNGSRSRLLALSTRHGSRAEELFGTGTFVSALDVSMALGS